MTNEIQAIALDRLACICGGGTRGGRKARPSGEPISPMTIGKGDIDAPVYGSRGRLNPRQTRNLNAAYAARQGMIQDLGLSSNSGAVESVQLHGMIERAQDE